MRIFVKDDTTASADQLRPARRLAALVRKTQLRWTPLPALADCRHVRRLGSIDGKEVDGKSNRSKQDDSVRRIRRYRMHRSKSKHDIMIPLGQLHESQIPTVHSEKSPCAMTDLVSTKQSGRDCLFGPLGTGAHETKADRHFAPRTRRAGEFRPHSFSTRVLLQYPSTNLEWRTVADVLVVAARELGHPVTVLVEVEPRDCPLHGSRVTAHSGGHSRRSVLSRHPESGWPDEVVLS
jgi:hypothetical protein